MIAKVLIAEDHESVSISLEKTLIDLRITDVIKSQHCDDALNKITLAKLRGQSFDLLITDLSFEDDGTTQHLKDGEALIEAARQIQPDLKVLVFSASNEAAVIDTLYNKLEIDGYVRKARNDAKELKMAIEQIDNNQRYLPRKLVELINRKNAHNFSEFDIAVITLLSQGIRQKDIPAHLKKKLIQPSSLSSIEKRLNQIKEVYGFSTNEHLVADCIENGII